MVTVQQIERRLYRAPLPGDPWLVPRGYQTPASAYPKTRVGRARIVRRAYPPAVYEMYGVRGHRYYQLDGRLLVTALEIAGQTWMVDDPVHWEAVQELAARFRPGRALIAGLGLGLIVHALAARSDVEAIVVERDPDVIALIEPRVPNAHVGIVQADFWDVVATVTPGEYSTLFVDLWVGDGPALWHAGLGEIWEALEARFGETAEVIMFGYQGRVDQVREMRRAWANVPDEVKACLLAQSVASVEGGVDGSGA
jgi:hypothetical protein